MLVLALLLLQVAAEPTPVEGVAVGAPAHVVLECRVTADAHVGQCKVLKEQPAGKGFGDAAIRLSQNFRVSPSAREGDMIRLPMVFKNEDGSPPVAPPPGLVVRPPSDLR